MFPAMYSSGLNLYTDMYVHNTVLDSFLAHTQAH